MFLKLLKKGAWRWLAVWFAVLFTVSVTATVVAENNAIALHSRLGTAGYRLVETDPANAENAQYFTSEETDWKDRLSAARALVEEIATEGNVLIENNGALPLEEGAEVSVFSRSCVDLVYGGTGSGGINAVRAVSLDAALHSVGVKVNPSLWKFYQDRKKSYRRTTSNVAEIPVSDYPQSLERGYADYSDAAIVVLSRMGGEGADIDVPSRYMEIQPIERELLEYVCDRFDRVIVLVNSANALSLHALKDYPIGACLWMGYPGETGLLGTAKLLRGLENPSGRLADTYAASSTSSPAMQNFGNFTYANAKEIHKKVSYGRLGSMHQLYGESVDHYVVEAEGIYVGYRYYETRYEDSVLERGNARGNAGARSQEGWKYEEEVDYPFGHGLSYTTFTQTLDGVRFEKGQALVDVTVTNTGERDGKDVVQVYAQTPYTDYDREHGIEKSAIQLVGYVKTDVLKKGGGAQSLTVRVNLEDFATYDYAGYGTYIMEAGDYYLAIGDDAHDALDHILAHKKSGHAGNAQLAYGWRQAETDTKTYAISSATGNPVQNRFDNADLNYYIDGGVTYLSRRDWQNTFPKRYENLTATEKMIDDLKPKEREIVPYDHSITYGADNGLRLVQLREAAFDDPRWEQLLDQMTLREQCLLIGYGGGHTEQVESVASPSTLDHDGPAGLSHSSYLTSPDRAGKPTGETGVAYTAEVVLASSFNTELAERMGRSIGEDALWTGTTGWYGGPAVNTHRTPYGGRNYEYYSEDGILAGKIAAAVLRGTSSKGLNTFVKHFAFNEQDTNRYGVCTFMNEQAMREIYLTPFRYAFTQGWARSTMTSYVRIGCIWTGAHVGLVRELLRGEWGFHGKTLTDCIISAAAYNNVCEGVLAGNNMWLTTNRECADLLQKCAKNDLTLRTAIRGACREILYAQARSSAMNGITSTTEVVACRVWWQNLLLALDIAFGAVFVLSLAAWASGEIFARREEKYER